MNEKEKNILLKIKQDIGLDKLPNHSIDEQGNITKLSLANSSLSSLPDYLFKLTDLYRLSLLNNELKTIPSSIGNLTKLKLCYLDRNQLEQLPESFGDLKALTLLVLYENQLTSLPDSIGNLTKLETLQLSDNRLKQLPKTFGELQILKILELERNCLENLSNSLGNLNNLKYLNLNENSLIKLPETIGKLKSLTQLQLEKNSLKELPPSIGQLRNLTHLYLDGNDLTSIPPEIGQLENLDYLDLGYNIIEELPPEIGSLKKLSYLNLIANNLSELPETIGKLNRLSWLCVINNNLNTLPDSIGQLSNLESIYLYKNDLNNLSSSFWNLTQLKELWVENNQIESISSEITQLNELRVLILDDDLFEKVTSAHSEWIVKKRGPIGGRTIWKIADKVCTVNFVNIKHKDHPRLVESRQNSRYRTPKRLRENNTKKFLDIIRDFRKIGFFEQYQELYDKELLLSLQKERKWNKKPDYNPKYPNIRYGPFKVDADFLELEILLHDTNRVWYEKLRLIEHSWYENRCTSLFNNWTNISKEVFIPTEIQEIWKDIKDYEYEDEYESDFPKPDWVFLNFSFKFNGKKYCFDEGTQFYNPSPDILQSIVNRLIQDSGYQLEDITIEHSRFNRSKYYIFLTTVQKQHLKARGWKFREGPNYAERIFQNYSSEYCTKGLSQYQHPKISISRHTQIKCPLCGKYFLEPQISNKKKKIYCSGCRKFISCPYCNGKEFTDDCGENYERHLIFCADCDKQIF